MLPLDASCSELVNIGTLFAFVDRLRGGADHAADAPRRPPAVPGARWCPVVPVLGILSCLLLMFSLPPENWLRLFVWLALGLVIYFGYGRRHSVVGRTAA